MCNIYSLILFGRARSGGTVGWSYRPACGKFDVQIPAGRKQEMIAPLPNALL